jgi:hypothetical protein
MAENEVEAVLQGLRGALNNSLAAVGFTSSALREFHKSVEAHQVYPENPDPMYYLGTGDPNVTMAPYAAWRRSQVLDQVQPDGPVDTLLGYQWIALFYAEWDEYHRPRLAKALGCGTKSVRIPLMGDLRRLRHDVIHGLGIASKEWTGRCEVLGHWFSPGERIALRGPHYNEFYTLFPWDMLSVRPDVKQV